MILADLVIEVIDHAGNVVKEFRVPMDELPANADARAGPRIRASIQARNALLMDAPLPPWGNQHAS